MGAWHRSPPGTLSTYEVLYSGTNRLIASQDTISTELCSRKLGYISVRPALSSAFPSETGRWSSPLKAGAQARLRALIARYQRADGAFTRYMSWRGRVEEFPEQWLGRVGGREEKKRKRSLRGSTTYGVWAYFNEQQYYST